MRTVWMAGLAIAFTGCTSTQAVRTERISVDWPEPNQSVEIEIGESVIEKGELAPRETLLLFNEVTWNRSGIGNLGVSYTILPGVLVGLQRDDEFIYYDSDNMYVRGGTPLGAKTSMGRIVNQR